MTSLLEMISGRLVEMISDTPNQIASCIRYADITCKRDIEDPRKPGWRAVLHSPKFCSWILTTFMNEFPRGTIDRFSLLSLPEKISWNRTRTAEIFPVYKTSLLDYLAPLGGYLELSVIFQSVLRGKFRGTIRGKFNRAPRGGSPLIHFPPPSGRKEGQVAFETCFLPLNLPLAPVTETSLTNSLNQIERGCRSQIVSRASYDLP